MSDESKVSDNSGQSSACILSKLAEQGIPLDSVIKNLNPDDIHAILLNQYNFLNEKYLSLEAQLKQVETLFSDHSKDAAQRMEKILSLMLSNMMFIKQLIQMADVNNDKVIEQDRLNSKHEFQFSNIVDRQNRFAMSLNNLDKNNKTIIDEISKLKEKTEKHDRFQWKIITIGSLIMGAIAWLMAGDNLTKLIVLLSQFSEK